MFKKDKPQEVEKLKNLIKDYSVIGILNMQGLPAKQLQKIKMDLSDRAVIRMSKKNLIKRALEETNKDYYEKVKDYLKNEVALLLSNENPFKLYKFLKDNKSPAPAKAGQLAKKDIIIKKGSTGLPPGPAISTLGKLNLKTSVQDGKIAVLQDKTVCKEGEEITSDMVDVFSLLKMEPMEIGLDLKAAIEDGIVYDRSVLDVDQEEYKQMLEKAVAQAFNLSINSDYPTKETIEVMITKSVQEAKAMAIEANIMDKEIIGDIIAKAIAESKALENKIND